MGRLKMSYEKTEAENWFVKVNKDGTSKIGG